MSFRQLTELRPVHISAERPVADGEDNDTRRSPRVQNGDRETPVVPCMYDSEEFFSKSGLRDDCHNVFGPVVDHVLRPQIQWWEFNEIYQKASTILILRSRASVIGVQSLSAGEWRNPLSGVAGSQGAEIRRSIFQGNWAEDAIAIKIPR
jgi:hypothetical protein